MAPEREKHNDYGEIKTRATPKGMLYRHSNKPTWLGVVFEIHMIGSVRAIVFAP